MAAGTKSVRISGAANLTHRKKIGEVLVEMGLLTSEKVEFYLAQAGEKKIRLGEYLVREKIITDHELAKGLARQYGLKFQDLSTLKPDFKALQQVPEKMIRANNILPLGWEAHHLIIASYDPLLVLNNDFLKKLIRVPYQVRICPRSQVETWMRTVLDKKEDGKNDAERTGKKDEAGIEAGSAEPESVETLVNNILSLALEEGASDVHLDPAEKVCRVRIRIDGVLRVIYSLPVEMHPFIASRLKVLSSLDIAERRLPQDGRFSYKNKAHSTDIRISVLPTVFGEKVVLRLMDRQRFRSTLDELGMGASFMERCRWLLSRPYGIILVTGPTGSGKTTTLYAMLSQINSPARNIITVEDPVEYPFDVLNQVQVNEKAGLNFANVLRNILRQDPDVLMIGEIRDRETADIAIRSALTGHLVLSTLHTNDAITTATRLIDMGVEPFLLGSALLGMISQRLVRLLCAKCKVPHEITDREAELLGSERVRAGLKSFKPNPSGCAECQSAGFRGRTPLFEMLVPDKVLQRAIADRKSESEISQYAQSQLGYRSMREDAIDKLLAGVTSFDEIIKATS